MTDIIWAALVPGRRGPKSIRLSEAGRVAIASEVRRAIAEGDIRECCEAALVMIGFLSSRDEAREAVCELNRLRHELRREVDAAFRARSEETECEARALQEKSAAALGEKREMRAEMFGTPAPAGTIKSRALKPIPSIIR